MLTVDGDAVRRSVPLIAVANDSTEKEASRLLRRLERWKEQSPGLWYALSKTARH